MHPTLVTSYPNPDLDAVAGVIAYAEFLQKTGKHAVAGVIGEPHDEAKYVLDRFAITHPQVMPDKSGYDEVVLVDASDVGDLGGKVALEKVIEIIDHRKVNEADKFPKAKVQIELVGAAATLVAERFMQNKVDISKAAATLLYVAIISNTLNFKGSVTTDRDKEAAAWLNEIAELPQNFTKDLFTAKSNLSGDKLVERVRGDFKDFAIGGKKVGIAQVEIIGAKKLLDERSEEIVQELGKMKEEMGLDLIFQNTVELEDNKNFFVAHDADTKKLLEKALNVKFINSVAERLGLILRKQIVPLLMQELQ